MNSELNFTGPESLAILVTDFLLVQFENVLSKWFWRWIQQWQPWLPMNLYMTSRLHVWSAKLKMSRSRFLRRFYLLHLVPLTCFSKVSRGDLRICADRLTVYVMLKLSFSVSYLFLVQLYILWVSLYMFSIHVYTIYISLKGICWLYVLN